MTARRGERRWRPARLAAIAVAVLAVVACDNGSDTDAAGTGATAPPDAPVPGSEDATATTAPAAGDATPPAGGGPTSTAATVGGGPGTTAGGGDGGAGFPALDARVPVGGFAPALLQPDQSERLVIEVHADVEPRGATLDHVADLLAAVSGKPVSVVRAAAPGGGDRAWTSTELAAAADAASTTGQGNGVAAIRLLFLHGTFEGDDGVLGVAVRGDVAAVFVDRVDAAAGLLGGATAIERAVTAHELGHLLGLVDLHLDTGRADPDHPGHSPNRGSVMYWAVESDLVGQVLGADPPDQFDAADLADLTAIRNG